MKAYIDGEYFDRDNAKISVFDHGLLYGDGVFEGIRIYHGHIFKLQEHLERLFDSAKAIFLDIPLSIDKMRSAVYETAAKNQIEDGYIRLVVTRGKGDLGISPLTCPKATVIIIADKISLYPEAYYKKGIKIITASSRRIPSDALDPKIKSLNYLNNVLAKLEAIHAGCMEAIMLNKQGYVCECTGDNIFYIKKGILHTPDITCGALNGITRQTVLDASKKIGLKAKVSHVTCYDLYTADECFLTGTAAEIIPVINIDGRIIGKGKPGELTADIQDAFFKMVENISR
jgi:branched-chain amino acid aminotransferase